MAITLRRGQDQAAGHKPRARGALRLVLGLVLAVFLGLAGLLALAWSRGGPVAMRQITVDVAAKPATAQAGKTDRAGQ